MPCARPALAVLALALTAARPAAAAEPPAGSSARPAVDRRETVYVYGEREGLVDRESGVAMRSDVPIIETPMSISVITEERMQDLGVLTVQDTFMYSAGVHGGAFGTDARGDWATIRGSEPVEYIDGLKSLFGYYNNTRTNPYTLGRVEILKGPASVTYGQGSTGGVVNLTSKRPRRERATEVWAQYGSFDRKQIAADSTGALDAGGQWLYRVVALYRDSEMQTDHVADDSAILAPSLTWAPTDATRVTVLANLEDNDSGTSTPFLPWAGTRLPGPSGDLDTATFVSEPGWDRYDTEQTAITALVDHRFNEDWSAHLAARHTDSGADYRSMWPDFPPTFLADGRSVSRTAYVSDASSEGWTVDAHLQAGFDTGPFDHTVVAGVDHQDAETDNDFFYGYSAGGVLDLYSPVYGNVPAATPLTDFASSTSLQTGLYLQDHIRHGEHWIVSFGLRADAAESRTARGGGTQEDEELTARAGIMYRFDSGIAPYFSWSESFNPIIGTDLAGNAFVPLAGEQFEGGVKYQPPGTAHLVTFAVYDITEANRQTDDPTNPFNTLQTGEVGIQGVELEAQTTWRDFDVLAAYGYTDTEVTKSNAGDEGFNLSNIPDHLASVWVTWQPRQRWPGFHAGAGVRHVGESWDGADTLRTPSYTLVDASVGYELRGWQVSVDADNLADDVHVTSCLARGDCFYGARRTVTANVRYRF